MDVLKLVFLVLAIIALFVFILYWGSRIVNGPLSFSAKDEILSFFDKEGRRIILGQGICVENVSEKQRISLISTIGDGDQLLIYDCPYIRRNKGFVSQKQRFKNFLGKDPVSVKDYYPKGESLYIIASRSGIVDVYSAKNTFSYTDSLDIFEAKSRKGFEKLIVRNLYVYKFQNNRLRRVYKPNNRR